MATQRRIAVFLVITSMAIQQRLAVFFVGCAFMRTVRQISN